MILSKRAASVAMLAAMAFAGNAMAGPSLVIGTDPTFSPYESVNKEGKLVGFEMELGKALCKQLDAKCEWVRMSFPGIIPALKSQKITMGISGFGITEKRRKQVLFSVSWINSPTRMMTAADKDIDTTLAAVKGKTIGIVQGTFQANYANEHWRGKGVNLMTFQNDDLARQGLKLGRVDATLQDSAAGESWIMSPAGKGFHLTGAPLVISKGTAIIMRKGDEDLQKKVNQAIFTLVKNGTYEKILAKYKVYGFVVPPELKKLEK